ncbi:MAG: hypothetical protein AAGU32_12715, partial [Bacillota bacterium]
RQIPSRPVRKHLRRSIVRLGVGNGGSPPARAHDFLLDFLKVTKAELLTLTKFKILLTGISGYDTILLN